MKKQIATISILILFLVFSTSSVRVSAGCGRPKCVGGAPVAAPTLPTDETPASALNPGSPETAPTTAQPENSFSLVLSVLGWAIGFAYFR